MKRALTFLLFVALANTGALAQRKSARTKETGPAAKRTAEATKKPADKVPPEAAANRRDSAKLAPLAPPPPGAGTPGSSRALDDQIDAIIGNEPEKWGVLATKLPDGPVVYAHNENALLLPASNMKALTTAAALDALGPTWKTKTSVYAAERPGSDGVLAGDLVLYGRGDPNLSGRFTPNDALGPLRVLAASLRAAGVRSVKGALVADESYLSGPPHGAGWAFADLQWHFGAEVSALSFADNLADIQITPGASGQPCQVKIVPDVGYVQIANDTHTDASPAPKISVHRDLDGNRVDIAGTLRPGKGGWSGAVAVREPALYAAAAFRRALADEGIALAGPTRRLTAYDERPPELALDKLVELASIDSLPLADMVRVVNKHSQNLHAELILRMLGRERGLEGAPSDEAGSGVVVRFLQRVNAAAPGMVLRDGCGLSRLDRVTPSMLDRLAVEMARHEFGAPFVDSLPEAGVDGTLRNRDAKVRLRAKTGSLDIAKSLTGYLTTNRTNTQLAISIVYNDWSGTGDGIGKIDRIVAALAAQ